MWDRNICLSNKKTIFVIVIIFFSTLLIASVWPNNVEETKELPQSNNKEDMWVPTEEDIAYQDSMFTIIQNTQDDVTEIKEDIVLIIERLDYEDGTHDSVKYVKGGPIDRKRN